MDVDTLDTQERLNWETRRHTDVAGVSPTGCRRGARQPQVLIFRQHSAVRQQAGNTNCLVPYIPLLQSWLPPDFAKAPRACLNNL